MSVIFTQLTTYGKPIPRVISPWDHLWEKDGYIYLRKEEWERMDSIIGVISTQKISLDRLRELADDKESHNLEECV